MTRTTLRGSYRAKQRRTQHQSLWKKLNRERSFNKTQGQVFGLLVLAIFGSIGAIGLAQGPLFHSYINQQAFVCNDYNIHVLNLRGITTSSCPNDPSTYIWDSVNSVAPSCFDYTNYLGACSGATKNGHTATVLNLVPNSTDSSVQLAKSPIDLSITSSKQIWGLLSWTSIALPATNGLFGMFLTTNKTLPTHQPNFDPRAWQGTAYVLLFSLTSGTTFAMNEYIQKQSSNTILSDAHSCSTSSSCWLSTSFTLDPTTNWVLPTFFLNYTSRVNGGSCSGVQGSGCSAIEEFQTTTIATSQAIPPFPFNSGAYYVGFWAGAGVGTTIQFTMDSSAGNPSVCVQECNEILLYVPAPTAPTAPANLDTGGFFGPIIRALIAVGVFIAANMISFFSYLYSLIVPILAGLASIIGVFLETIINAFGAIFGDNSLGTQVHTAFSQILNYLTQIFASAVAIWGNIITTLLRFLTFITGFFGSNPFVTFIENFLAQAPNFWTVLNGVWADIMQYYISGVFTIQTILVFWYLFGMYEVYMHGLSGFKSWLQTSEIGFFGIFKAGYWLIDEAYGFIVQLKQLIFGNTVSPVKVAGTG